MNLDEATKKVEFFLNKPHLEQPSDLDEAIEKWGVEYKNYIFSLDTDTPLRLCNNFDKMVTYRTLALGIDLMREGDLLSEVINKTDNLETKTRNLLYFTSTSMYALSQKLKNL